MSLFSLIKEDLLTCTKRGLVRQFLAFWFNTSLGLVINYRLGHYLASRRNIFYNVLILYLKSRQNRKYACDISYHAKIGRRIKFPHPIGIVIGEGVIIEDDVMIWQNVTLGSTGKGTKMKYPRVKSNTKIFSAAQILGEITIGVNSKIGASSLVLNNVPDSKTAVGIPARVIG